MLMSCGHGTHGIDRLLYDDYSIGNVLNILQEKYMISSLNISLSITS